MTKTAKEQEEELNIGVSEKVGDYLRRVREARGVELEHLAKAIRLNKNILESIEANRWNDFPTEAYLRSYMISMCEKLFVDKNAVIQRFSNDINSRFAVSQSNLMTNPSQEEDSSRSNVPKIVIIAILAIALLLFLSKQILDSSGNEPAKKPAPPVVAPVSIENEEGASATIQEEKEAVVPEVQAVNTNAMDTLRFECIPSSTDNTCGVSLRSVDSKMYYFTKLSTRYIKQRDTSHITVTVPERTRLFLNGSRLEYGKYNTLLFHQGKIVGKSNRELR